MYLLMILMYVMCMYSLPVGYPCDEKRLTKKNDDVNVCDDELCM